MSRTRCEVDLGQVWSDDCGRGLQLAYREDRNTSYILQEVRKTKAASVYGTGAEADFGHRERAVEGEQFAADLARRKPLPPNFSSGRLQVFRPPNTSTERQNRIAITYHSGIHNWLEWRLEYWINESYRGPALTIHGFCMAPVR